jgi:hypothetical protein
LRGRGEAEFTTEFAESTEEKEEEGRRRKKKITQRRGVRRETRRI